MTMIAISQAAELHGVKRTNDRWSWGGYCDDGSIVLFVWGHRTRSEPGRQLVDVVDKAELATAGGRERLAHVEAIASGVRGFALLGYNMPDDNGKQHWFIDRQGATLLWTIARISVPDDKGTQWAVLTRPNVTLHHPTVFHRGVKA